MSLGLWTGWLNCLDFKVNTFVFNKLPVTLTVWQDKKIDELTLLQWYSTKDEPDVGSTVLDDTKNGRLEHLPLVSPLRYRFSLQSSFLDVKSMDTHEDKVINEPMFRILEFLLEKYKAKAFIKYFCGCSRLSAERGSSFGFTGRYETREHCNLANGCHVYWGQTWFGNIKFMWGNWPVPATWSCNFGAATCPGCSADLFRAPLHEVFA